MRIVMLMIIIVCYMAGSKISWLFGLTIMALEALAARRMGPPDDDISNRMCGYYWACLEWSGLWRLQFLDPSMTNLLGVKFTSLAK